MTSKLRSRDKGVKMVATGVGGEDAGGDGRDSGHHCTVSVGSGKYRGKPAPDNQICKDTVSVE